ncbi:flp pilus assembly protein CpaB [Oceanobacillus piezotolerans]|uniref:Flp pilus assembly protein CpaB n=1 Tax=Oceanobacillus piezotolerans TaxID=2448030 RepID=A0A498D9V2_9BACI|nr:flp pilus assembly protein CpaB [Oceanobacillus piezotolerans]RLL46514.1 flp pilus assembly protein CpaB [Oceanobacillus piezotolerans]
MFESKRRALIFITLSFILAAIAGLMFFNTYADLNENLGQTTEIYIADKNIPSRESISSEHVRTMQIPNRFITDAHILSLNQLEDQVSIVPLLEGDILTTSMLRPYSDVTEEGNRLVKLFSEWDNVHFDQNLEALDRVDIVVSQSTEEGPETEIFMRDIPVANVETNEEGNPNVTLEVAVEEAPSLIHVQNYADSVRVLKANSGKDQDNLETAENTQSTNRDKE